MIKIKIAVSAIWWVFLALTILQIDGMLSKIIAVLLSMIVGGALTYFWVFA